MKIISLTPGSKSNPLIYSKRDNAFYGTEKSIPFDITYTVKNTVTKNSEIFEFAYSTGPEFDPDTQWVYKSNSGIRLIVCNDAEITRIRGELYLKHKIADL